MSYTEVVSSPSAVGGHASPHVHHDTTGVSLPSGSPSSQVVFHGEASPLLHTHASSGTPGRSSPMGKGSIAMTTLPSISTSTHVPSATASLGPTMITVGPAARSHTPTSSNGGGVGGGNGGSHAYWPPAPSTPIPPSSHATTVHHAPAVGVPTSSRKSSRSISNNGANGSNNGNTTTNTSGGTTGAAATTATTAGGGPMSPTTLTVITSPPGGPATGTTTGGKLTFSPPAAATFATPQRSGVARTPQQYAEIIAAAKRAGQENTKETNHRGCIFSCMNDPWKALKLFMSFCWIVLGIGISILVYYTLRNNQLTTWESSYAYQCGQRSAALQQQLDIAGIKMYAYAGFVSSLVQPPSRLVADASLTPFTQQQFQVFSNVSRATDYLDLVLWSRVIRVSTNTTNIKAEWEAAQNKTIWDLGVVWTNSSCTRSGCPYSLHLPPSQGSYYAPIETMNPSTILVGGIPTDLTGWNLNQRLSSGGAIVNITVATRTGELLATGRANSLVSPASGPGVLVTVPVFSTPYTPLPALRTTNVLGVVLGIVPVTQLLNRAVGSFTEEINLYVRDVQDVNAISVMGRLVKSTNVDQSHNYTIPFTFGLRSYELVCTPSVSYVNTAYTSFPTTIAIGTGVLFFVNLLVLALGSSCLDLRKALRRTDDLTAANESKNLALRLLEEARTEADNANRSKSDFMAFLCHELRNPLHAIVSMIEFLGAASNRMGQEDMDCVHTIRASVSMMRSIVNDALDMTKIESGNIEFESVPFSLRDVVQTLVRVERAQAQSKGLELIETIDSSVPRALLGDPTRIRQVLINFVSNAIKFTKHGSVNLSVRMMSPIEAQNNGLYVFTCAAHDIEPAPVPTPTGAATTTDGNAATSHTATAPQSTAIIVPSPVPTPRDDNGKKSNGGGSGNHENKIPELTAIDITIPHDNGGTSMITPTPPVGSSSSLPPSPLPANGTDGAKSFANRFPHGWVAIELRVTDTGMGIEPNLLPRLFEPYSQAKLSIMRDHGGTGLGLAIVSRIVSMMGGRVFVESHLGTGSSFIAQIALAIAPPDSHLVLPGTAHAQSHSTSTPTHTPTPTETPPAKPSPLLGARAFGLPSGAASGSGASMGAIEETGVTTGGIVAPVAVMNPPTLGLGSVGTHRSSTPPGTGATPGNRHRRPILSLEDGGNGSSGNIILPGSPLARVRYSNERNSGSVGSGLNEVKRGPSSLSSASTSTIPPSTSSSLASTSMQAAVSMRLLELTNSGQLTAIASSNDNNDHHHDGGDGMGHTGATESIAVPNTNTIDDALAPPLAATRGHDSPAIPTSTISPNNNTANIDSLAALRAMDTQAVGTRVRTSSVDNNSPRVGTTTIDTNGRGDEVNNAASPLQGIESPTPGGHGAAEFAALNRFAESSRSTTATTVPTTNTTTPTNTNAPPVGVTSSVPLRPRPRPTQLTNVVTPGGTSTTIATGSANMSVRTAPTKDVDGGNGPEDAAAAQARKLRRMAAAAQAQAKADAAVLVQKYGPRLLLVVDDAPVNVKILVKMLNGLECITATNGLEAVEAVRRLSSDGLANGTRRQFDIILTDVIMPLMDGIQAAGAIRKLEDEEGLPHVPIVAITANAMSQDRQRCAEAGMTFLSKPFIKEDLFRLLDATMAPSAGLTSAPGPIPAAASPASPPGTPPVGTSSLGNNTSINVSSPSLSSQPGLPSHMIHHSHSGSNGHASMISGSDGSSGTNSSSSSPMTPFGSISNLSSSAPASASSTPLIVSRPLHISSLGSGAMSSSNNMVNQP